jgi:acylglycerol lipase
MGGAEALHYILTTSSNPAITSARSHLKGVILESPFIALHPSSEPYRITVAAGRVAAKLFPNMQMLQKLDPKYVTRNEEVQKSWDSDDLCHDTGTLAGIGGMLDRAGQLVTLSTTNPASAASSGLSLIAPCPVLFTHGTQDLVTSYDASKKLYERLSQQEANKAKVGFKAYQGAYHQLHVEPDGVAEQFARDVGDWIVGVAKGTGDLVVDKGTGAGSGTAGLAKL